MVLRLELCGIAREPQRGEVGAQLRERLLVHEPGEEVGGIREHLRLAHALEQGRELAACRRDRGGTHLRHQRLPGRLEKAARFGGLGHGDPELRKQRLVRRKQPQLREQAVEFGARDFFAESFGHIRLGSHSSVMRCSLGLEYMSTTRQSLHIFSRSAAAPWNAA
ncbi:hypothetical protein D3C78_1429470 [compost metagenome]